MEENNKSYGANNHTSLLSHTQRFFNYLVYNVFKNYLLRTHSNFLVHLTYKTEFLVFPLFQPAATPSEHNTTFTRSQNLQTPVAALLLNLSQTCSGFGLLVCSCS